MSPEEMCILFDYNAWANRRSLTVAAALTPEQFTKPMGSSFSSVRDTLGHIFGGEWIWLERVMEYKTLKFGVYSNPLWQSMQHVVNHGSYHRGQVTTMLRQHGAQPVLTDLMHFYRERSVAAKA